MRVAAWSLPALTLLADAHLASAKAILSPKLLRAQADFDSLLKRDSYEHAGELERRSPQTTQPPSADPSTTNSGSLEIGTESASTNVTIAESCSRAFAGKTTTVNAAGFTGCYNILEWNPATTEFQADLRVYTTAPANDRFVGVPQEMILVLLDFPGSAVFRSLTKRSSIQLIGRQQANQEIQQYSLTGSLNAPLDLSKLTELQIASLMVPQISMQATSNDTRETFTAAMTTDDMALFTSGQFTALAASVKEVADPNTAAAAIKTSQAFILPGTTFGIFPVGFIVTSIWAFLFFVVYGAGTVARFRYRSIYRKRLAAMASRTHMNPTMGPL